MNDAFPRSAGRIISRRKQSTCVSLGFNVLALRSGSEHNAANMTQMQGYKIRSFLDNNFYLDVDLGSPRAEAHSDPSRSAVTRHVNENGPDMMLSSRGPTWSIALCPRSLLVTDTIGCVLLKTIKSGWRDGVATSKLPPFHLPVHPLLTCATGDGKTSCGDQCKVTEHLPIAFGTTTSVAITILT